MLMENQSLSLKKSNDLNVSQMNDLLDILDEAEAHPEFHGYGLIHGDVFNRRRLVIVIDQQAVGFMTPRFEDGYWRTGAIFVSKKYAGKGYGRDAIKTFFSDVLKRPARVWIADENIQSQKAFKSAGFVLGQKKDLSDLPQDFGHMWHLR